MTVAFELEGRRLPHSTAAGFKFNEAISFQVNCETQEEWTITGRSSPRVGTSRPSSAAGSRTDTRVHGRSAPHGLFE